MHNINYLTAATYTVAATDIRPGSVIKFASSKYISPRLGGMRRTRIRNIELSLQMDASYT